MKVFKIFEFAYLGIMIFFLYSAYTEWGVEGGKGPLYLLFAGVALFMFFFKRKFRKKFEANRKPK
ncbi:hypothetical protein HN014_04800 [Aquimarina sp. TRL1]|nr:hypothetical protein HN014_04800 [Aquimarina sp. TRL1]